MLGISGQHCATPSLVVTVRHVGYIRSVLSCSQSCGYSHHAGFVGLVLNWVRSVLTAPSLGVTMLNNVEEGQLEGDNGNDISSKGIF